MATINEYIPVKVTLPDWLASSKFLIVEFDEHTGTYDLRATRDNRIGEDLYAIKGVCAYPTTILIASGHCQENMLAIAELIAEHGLPTWKR